MPYQSYANPFVPYNAYQQSPQMQYTGNTQQQGLVRVTGIEGAKAYQMPPNSMMALFDANDDIFYFKTTDGGGFPTIKVFRFQEVQPSTPAQPQYVTVADIQAVYKEIETLREAINGKQPVQSAAAE